MSGDAVVRVRSAAELRVTATWRLQLVRETFRAGGNACPTKTCTGTLLVEWFWSLPCSASLQLLQSELHAFERRLHPRDHHARISVRRDPLIQLQRAVIVVGHFLHLVFLLRQTAHVARIVPE